MEKEFKGYLFDNSQNLIDAGRITEKDGYYHLNGKKYSTFYYFADTRYTTKNGEELYAKEEIK
jgi:hypothetical protein